MIRTLTIRSRAALLAAGLLLPTDPAGAGVVDTPDCRIRLARAWDLVGEVAARDRAGAPRGDTAALCRVLRRNAVAMKEARDGMAACMTGHERGENVGQMDVSLEDVHAVLASRCR